MSRIRKGTQSVQRISNADKRTHEPEPETDYQAMRLAELRSAVRGVINTVVGQAEQNRVLRIMATKLGVNYASLVDMRDGLNQYESRMLKPVNSYIRTARY